MKRSLLLKAIVITVPVLVALYAQYYENKKQDKLDAFYGRVAHQEVNTLIRP
jgi:hypothetical protein